MNPFFLAAAVLLSLSTVSLNAQTVTHSVMPAPGTALHYVTVGTNLSPGLSGSGITWDFSAADNSGTATDSFMAPSAAPDYATFSNAALASLTDQHQYRYYHITPTEVTVVGLSDGGAIGLNPPILLHVFPYVYGAFTTYSHDTFRYDMFLDTTFFRDRDTLSADGYGTLITPSGTFQNVMRVKTVSTSWAHSLFDNDTTVTRTTDYNWYQEGHPGALLTIAGTGGSNAKYQVTSTTGIASVPLQPLSLFPNPARGSVSLMLPVDEPFTATLSDLLGRTVMEYAGICAQTLDLADVPCGTYVVHVRTATQGFSQRLVVQ